MSEKIYMSWDQFDSDINEFIKIINKKGFDKNSVILALKRGGFPTACALSNKLKKPMSTVTYQTRDGDDLEPRFLEPELINKDVKIILPDDIYDSGLTVENTVAALIEKFSVERVNILGLFHYGSSKMSQTSLITYECMRSNNGKWVHFSWE